MRDHISVDPANGHVIALRISSTSREGADDKGRIGKTKNSAFSLKCEKSSQ